MWRNMASWVHQLAPYSQRNSHPLVVSLAPSTPLRSEEITCTRSYSNFGATNKRRIGLRKSTGSGMKGWPSNGFMNSFPAHCSMLKSR